MNLATKAAGGAAAIGTSGVAGYAGYKLLVPNTIGEAVELTGKTLISKLETSVQDSAYQKALDRYLVETKDNTGGFNSIKISTVDSETAETNKKTKLKEYCEATEKSSFSNKEDDNYKRVSRWCTQFTSIKEKLNKELEVGDDKDGEWQSKYSSLASTDTKLKEGISKFKTESGTNADGKAFKAWCQDTFKRDSEETGLYASAGKCLLKTASPS